MFANEARARERVRAKDYKMRERDEARDMRAYARAHGASDGDADAAPMRTPRRCRCCRCAPIRVARDDALIFDARLRAPKIKMIRKDASARRCDMLRVRAILRANTQRARRYATRSATRRKDTREAIR